MEGSRLQINFERLLKKCENIASQNPDLFTAYLTQSDPFSGNVGSALDNFFEPVSNPEADYRKVMTAHPLLLNFSCVLSSFSRCCSAISASQ